VVLCLPVLHAIPLLSGMLRGVRWMGWSNHFSAMIPLGNKRMGIGDELQT
jgi:hypothetical protein